jgi:hypothetical protein
MNRFVRSVSALIAVSLPSLLPAEIPLPDATFYGHVTGPGGVPVGTGSLSARVARGGNVVLTVPARFVVADGETWFVARLPLETSIGAPGPIGLAAREGDSLVALVLSGKTLELASTPPALKAGLVSRLEATATEIPPPELVIFRGDCSPDLNIDLSDAVALLNFLFISPEVPACLAACDVDASGSLNITDGIFILQYLFLAGSAPPDPGAHCGPVPGTGELECAHTDCVQ